MRTGLDLDLSGVNSAATPEIPDVFLGNH